MSSTMTVGGASGVVTDEEIAETVHELEKAETALDAAEEADSTVGGKTVAGELQAARGKAHALRDKLRALQARQVREQAAERARASALAAFEPERAGVAKRLAKERERAVKAVVAAERAAAAVLVAAGEYDAAVKAAAADLRQRGISADGGEDLGAARSGVVHIDGETHRQVDPATLLGDLLAAAVKVRQPRHPVANLRVHDGAALAAGRKALLDLARGEGS